MVTLAKGNGFHRFTLQTIHLLDPVKKSYSIYYLRLYETLWLAEN